MSSDIGSVHSSTTGALNGARAVQALSETAPEQKARAGDAADRRDRVDLSQLARLRSRLKELPPVRTELVEQIRSEIDAGDYETADKIEKAVDEIARELAE